MALISACKQLQENQAFAWIKKKTRKKMRQNKKNDCAAKGGRESRKPTKTREKSKVAENQVFSLDFCALATLLSYPYVSKQKA